MVRSKEMEGGWKRVGGKHHKGYGVKAFWDVANRWRNKGGEAAITSFFITEFRDKWKAQDLLFELKEFGDLEEVVIPPKRDIRGRRYGFTRFLNVTNKKLFAIKLDIVMLEGRKLFANIPRFQRV